MLDTKKLVCPLFFLVAVVVAPIAAAVVVVVVVFLEAIDSSLELARAPSQLFYIVFFFIY